MVQERGDSESLCRGSHNRTECRLVGVGAKRNDSPNGETRGATEFAVDIKVDDVYLPVDEVNRLYETCGIPYGVLYAKGHWILVFSIRNWEIFLRTKRSGRDRQC